MSKSVILKEQDKLEIIKRVANILNRLGKLYMVPGWSDENAVILAEWVYDNYSYETLSAVESCLQNPPQTLDEHGRVENNWRLTPDRIQKWMSVQLEKEAIAREKEHAKYKELYKEELSVIDYESFKKRVDEGKALQDPVKTTGFDNPEYLAYKAERMRKLALQNPPNETD